MEREPVVRPFNLGDALLISRLQKDEVQVDLKCASIYPYNPLRAALTGLLPFGVKGASTYILVEEGGSRSGFLQVWESPREGEAKVLCLAPSLSADDAATIWKSLLAHLCLRAGERGLRRLFARLPDRGEELEPFQQVGFALYAREEVLRLERLPRSASPGQLAWRPRRPEDDWGIRQLWRSAVPPVVQQAEGWGRDEARECTPGDWPGGFRRGYVLEEEGEVVGYAGLVGGPLGYWLRVLLHHRLLPRARSALAGLLALLSDYPSRPVYCEVREYEGLQSAWQDLGFRPFARCALLVKYTAVPVQEPVWQPRPMTEKRPEAATPTVSRASQH